MSQFKPHGHRRWWIVGVVLVVVALAAVPAVVIGQHMFEDATGRTTVA
ncbi:hypothetical protein [Pseudarthrobacter sp. BIM B-2242]|nr:hypothetical protein [Pseudarthrobacter sp. BIM B-2242]QOD03699.1 hypothetical protein IDT60_00845 [Pseudarthrobacter sp. BIM B-2242]